MLVLLAVLLVLIAVAKPEWLKVAHGFLGAGVRVALRLVCAGLWLAGFAIICFGFWRESFAWLAWIAAWCAYFVVCVLVDNLFPAAREQT